MKDKAKQLTKRSLATSEAGSYAVENGELKLREQATVVPPLFSNRNQQAEAVQAEEPDTVSENSSTELTLDEVVAAISLIPEDVESLWTKQSGPRLTALESILEQPVSEELRAEAWKTYQQQSQEN